MVTFVALTLLFAAAINIYWYFADGRGEDFIKQARELKEYIQEHNEFSIENASEEHRNNLLYSPFYSHWIGNIHYSPDDD
ncbi:hypothetical protein [Desulfovulcanus sp.]